jgi:predicted nucleotidyltransferase
VPHEPSPPSAALDLRELLATLDRRAVDYTVIGGVAVQVHGHRRTTKDLDVILAPDEENLRRLTAALADLDAHPRDIPGGPVPTTEQLATAAVVPPLTTRHGELHILREVPGAPAYADLRARALVIELDGIVIAIAGLDDLIAMKRASGRPADIRDIDALTAIERAGDR